VVPHFHVSYFHFSHFQRPRFGSGFSYAPLKAMLTKIFGVQRQKETRLK